MSDDPPASPALTLEAPAKLNLSLTVTGRRADGLHELAGVTVLLELADDLLLAPGTSGLNVSGDAIGGVPADAAQNLAWRGLIAALGEAPAWAWSLAVHKRIPAQAGLGGGSSDAAAAWRLGRAALGSADAASPAELHDLANVGADVPFFAAQVPAAWVTGIGEEVAPLNLPASWPREVVLVYPPFGLSTAAVFAETRPTDWSSSPPDPPDPETAMVGGNDLFPAAGRLRPEIDDLRRLVLSAGAEPRMTGSGPTLFVLLDDPERADAIAARLDRAGLSVRRTRLRSEAASIGLQEVSS